MQPNSSQVDLKHGGVMLVTWCTYLTEVLPGGIIQCSCKLPELALKILEKLQVCLLQRRDRRGTRDRLKDHNAPWYCWSGLGISSPVLIGGGQAAAGVGHIYRASAAVVTVLGREKAGLENSIEKHSYS